MTLTFPRTNDSHRNARNYRIDSQTPENTSHFAMRITLFSSVEWRLQALPLKCAVLFSLASPSIKTSDAAGELMTINHVNVCNWTCGLRKVNDVACGRRQQVHDIAVSDYSSSLNELNSISCMR